MKKRFIFITTLLVLIAVLAYAQGVIVVSNQGQDTLGVWGSGWAYTTNSSASKIGVYCLIINNNTGAVKTYTQKTKSTSGSIYNISYSFNVPASSLKLGDQVWVRFKAFASNGNEISSERADAFLGGR